MSDLPTSQRIRSTGATGEEHRSAATHAGIVVLWPETP